MYNILILIILYGFSYLRCAHNAIIIRRHEIESCYVIVFLFYLPARQ